MFAGISASLAAIRTALGTLAIGDKQGACRSYRVLGHADLELGISY